MIEVIARNGPPEAMYCAAYICDACRRQVVGSGNVLHAVRNLDDRDDRRESSPLFIAHKECTRVVEAWMAIQYPPHEGWCDLWDELRDFTRHLEYNLTHSFADDAEGEYLDHVIVGPSTAQTAGEQP